MEPHAYNVNIEWTNDRKGIMSSPELNSTIEVATPPNFPKGMEGIWSPEHLLVTGKVKTLHFQCSAFRCYTFLVNLLNGRGEQASGSLDRKINGTYSMDYEISVSCIAGRCSKAV